ncbi:MAG: SGNH/GDSL hydrolase family protein, partial [Phycisphaerales bacterium]|nr:SGNH/GDSL hydrolase family protein [Phycisphaerales bacterium]
MLKSALLNSLIVIGLGALLAASGCQSTNEASTSATAHGNVMCNHMGMATCADSAPQHFFLHPGDRVCFYGDSITEQRLYTTFTESYITTRYPNLRVKFVDAGVGGDKVGGGWAGPIDLRLKRDVFPFKPTVVTIMLAMNDASYHPWSKSIFNVYAKGYVHIIKSLQAHLPGVRIVLIQPSAFDDVTQKPGFPLHLPWLHPKTNKLDDSHGGYNDVLLRYSAFVRKLAAKYHLLCVDFNMPLV